MTNVVSTANKIKSTDTRINGYTLIMLTYKENNKIGCAKMHVRTETTTMIQALEMFESEFPKRKIIGFNSQNRA